MTKNGSHPASQSVLFHYHYKQVSFFQKNPFEGLFGVFADSLPDGWGRLLVDRLLAKEQINPAVLISLTRLANSGYFAVKRFDREQNKRIHMVSVSGLLETSHRIPNLDYNILMQLTMQLTNSYTEIEKLYRLMCFNVFAHNWDDHSKNFTFLYKDGNWLLSPAYDLTYSNSIGGEHTTTVNGNGVNPSIEDLLAVAKNVRFNPKKASQIAREIQEITYTELNQFIN